MSSPPNKFDTLPKYKDMDGGIYFILLFFFSCHDIYKRLLEFRTQATHYVEVCPSVLHDAGLSCANVELQLLTHKALHGVESRCNPPGVPTSIASKFTIIISC